MSGAGKLADDCFALPKGVYWTPVDVALARLKSGLNPVTGSTSVPAESAGGRILAAPVLARRANPPFANAAVDGYGFAFAALPDPRHNLPLTSGRAAAGNPWQGKVPFGLALRILTGAALPEGVDTIVLQEEVTLVDGTIAFPAGIKAGANTRRAGEDVKTGARVFAAGHIIRSQDIALLAALGVGRVKVRRRLRVAVLSTGDELAPAGTKADEHQIYDANRPMLLDMVRRWGMTAVDLGCAGDTAENVAQLLGQGAAQADAILATGGASAGEEDHVSACLGKSGTIQTWRIAMKPGRPLALGLWQGVPVFGMPGNPVAAFVCALIFARPALALLAGGTWTGPQGFTLPAAFTKSKKHGRREYLRARINAEGAAETFRSEGSGRISGLSWADGLVELADAAQEIAPGDPVRFLPFSGFGL